MKILILLLISLNAYSSVKVLISNSRGQNYQAEFDTQQEADDWKADNLSNESWGKHARWEIKKSQTNCIQERDIIPDDGEMYTECKLDKEYTIVEVDTTEEVNEEKAKKLADKLERTSIKKMKSKINDSDLPKWHKRLLKMVIKQMRN